ncbi:PqqD family protein [Amycolatopsis sp. GM8]|uniref:PqqD family protein n=1 Tax=Amycolatopsis sp. GM8 TaxID=2896530 RepID=UPI001F321DF6|nr:PqqD family protein [Amycolatopsis sp. GM8]
MRLIRRNPARSALVLARGVAATPVGDGTMLVDRRGTLLHLNTTAAVMLDALLAGGLDAAATAAHQRFEITEDTARADAVRLLAQLLDRKLVRWT